MKDAIKDPKVIAVVVAILGSLISFTAKTYYDSRMQFEAEMQASIKELRLDTTRDRVITGENVNFRKIVIGKIDEAQASIKDLRRMATSEKVRTDNNIRVFKAILERVDKIETRIYEIHTTGVRKNDRGN